MQIEPQLQAEQARLLNEAQALVRRYWDRALEVRRTRPTSEWNKYGVRVRTRKIAISIEWFVNVMAGPKGRRAHRAFYVPRGPGSRYPMSKFPRATADWERAAIAEFEEAAGPLRRRADLLVRVVKLAGQYAALSSPPGAAAPMTESDKDREQRRNVHRTE